MFDLAIKLDAKSSTAYFNKGNYKIYYIFF